MMVLKKPEMLHVQCEHEVKSCDFLKKTQSNKILPLIPLLTYGCGWVGKRNFIHANVNVQLLSQNSGGIR